jgi:hypothetical protein
MQSKLSYSKIALITALLISTTAYADPDTRPRHMRPGPPPQVWQSNPARYGYGLPMGIKTIMVNDEAGASAESARVAPAH